MPKPQKPTPDFPLTPHARGRWCKKVDGKVLFFGTSDDPWEALDDYNHFVKTGQRRTSQNKSTKPKSGEKPRPKPPRGCPLKAAANGMWIWYNSRAGNPAFGSWKAGVTGEEAWQAFREWQRTGERPNSGRLTVHIAVNRFLTEFSKNVQTKEQIAHDGERRKSRSPATFQQYKAAAEVMVEVLGRHTAIEDISSDKWQKLRDALESGNEGQAKPKSPHTVKKYLAGVRRIVNYAKTLAEQNGQSLVLRVGNALSNPETKELKAALYDRDPKFIRREELLAVVQAADAQMKAITLLGINCGFHNMDFALLQRKHLDLIRRRVYFPRSKSKKRRYVVLWPETADAIKEWLTVWPNPSSHIYEDRVFLTQEGKPWVRNKDDTSHLTKRFNRALEDVGAKRRGISVGALRHTFETVAKMKGHSEIARVIMGHVEPLTNMDEFYVQQLDDSFDEFDGESAEEQHIRECVEAVRMWLYGRSTRRARTADSAVV